MTSTERTNAESEREITALEDQWERARDSLDLPTLKRILREDAFTLAPADTAVRPREQMLEGLEAAVRQRSKFGTTRDHTITNRVIKAANNVAVSTLQYVITSGRKGGELQRTAGHVVHIWAKDSTGWKLVGDYNFPYGRVPRQLTEGVKVEAIALSAYAGMYRQEHTSATLSVTAEKGALQGQWSNPENTGPQFPLKPISDTTFVAPVGNELTFVRSANGEVQEIILISDGPAVRVVKIK